MTTSLSLPRKNSQINHGPRPISSPLVRQSDESQSITSATDAVSAFVPTALAARLWSELVCGDSHLVYVCTPTGYGKTALLLHLQKEAERQGINSVILDCRKLDWRERRAALFNLPADRRSERTLVFIDNAHDAAELITSTRLADRAGSASNVRYVIASRTLPKTNRLSLQLSGHFVLLRAEDLRLEADEVAAILEHYSGRRPHPTITARVIELTEGWPLAVQLCGVSARSSADWLTAIRGSLEHAEDLATYFEDTVFTHLSASMKKFLMAVAPLDQFSAPLCSDVLGRDVVGVVGADALLSEAIRLGLFIMPATQAGWYRLHAGFRNYLNQRANETDRCNASITLTRARDWCRLHDQECQSIDYSLRLGDLQDATQSLLTVVSKCVGEFCQLNDVIRWSDAIERAPSDSPLTIRLWKLAALVFSMRLSDARRECELLETTPELTKQLELEPDLSMKLDQLRCSIAIKSDAMTEASDRALAWLDRYTTAPAFHRAAVTVAMAASCFARAQSEGYLQYLDLAKHIAAEADSAYVDAWVSTLEIMGECSGGFVDTTQCLVDHALESARRAMGDNSPSVATLSLLAARIMCEKRLFDDAERHLARGLAHLGDHGLIETAVAGLEAIVATSEARSGPLTALAEIRHQARAGYRFAARFEIEVARIVVMLLLRAGSVVAAREEFDLKINPTAYGELKGRIDPAVLEELRRGCRFVEATINVAERKYAEAAAICEELLQSGGGYGRTRRVVELLIVKAAALHGIGNVREARKAFSRALAIASERGYLHTMCDLDWAVRPFIGEADGLAAPHFLRSLRQRLGLPPVEEELTKNADVGVEPLTQREIEILTFLDFGLTNQEAAKRLYLSISTVKWHLQNIYSKLAVTNRSGALSKARKCGLLESDPSRLRGKRASRA